MAPKCPDSQVVLLNVATALSLNYKVIAVVTEMTPASCRTLSTGYEDTDLTDSSYSPLVILFFQTLYQDIKEGAKASQ